MMWNGSGSAGPGGSMAEFIQSLMTQRPDLAQILAQMTRQQSSGLGQLAGTGGMASSGGLGYNTQAGGARPNLGGGYQGTGPTLPYAQRFNTSPQPRYPAIPMPTAPNGGSNQQPYTPSPYASPMPGWGQPTAPTGPKFYPPSGPKQYGPATSSYTAPTGPKQYGFNQAPPAFSAPSQPKVYNPQPVTGDGTVGLDWYAQQAGA